MKYFTLVALGLAALALNVLVGEPDARAQTVISTSPLQLKRQDPTPQIVTLSHTWIDSNVFLNGSTVTVGAGSWYNSTSPLANPGPSFPGVGVAGSQANSNGFLIGQNNTSIGGSLGQTQLTGNCTTQTQLGCYPVPQVAVSHTVGANNIFYVESFDLQATVVGANSSNAVQLGTLAVLVSPGLYSGTAVGVTPTVVWSQPAVAFGGVTQFYHHDFTEPLAITGGAIVQLAGFVNTQSPWQNSASGVGTNSVIWSGNMWGYER